jgi:hypothetical protein
MNLEIIPFGLAKKMPFKLRDFYDFVNHLKSNYYLQGSHFLMIFFPDFTQNQRSLCIFIPSEQAVAKSIALRQYPLRVSKSPLPMGDILYKVLPDRW